MPIDDSETRDDTTGESSLPSAPSLYDDPAATRIADDGAPIPVFPDPEIVEALGHYRLLEVVGKGGAGIVYRAVDTRDDQTVAVKVIRPEMLASQTAAKRFLKEARLHSAVESSHVTRHIEVGEQNGLYFSVCEFVDGVTLRDIIESFVNRPTRDGLIIIRDLLRGLAALHSGGVVHRDVKPENLMVVFQRDASGELDLGRFQHAKLTDFGLARQMEQSESMAMTRQEAVLGTPLYMAPEQYVESKSADARSDVYSAGATLYHLLSGQPPFAGESVIELAAKHKREQPRSLNSLRPEISEAICIIVNKALEKQPVLRYQHAGEMLADVEQLLAGHPVSIRPYPTTPSTNEKSVRKYQFEFELDASVYQLWPLVADSDRFNRAMGLPAPDYKFSRRPPGHAGFSQPQAVFAEARFNGMKVRWQEHPFEWIFQRQMSVLREFDAGPFEWFTSTIHLAPLVDDRTRVTHQIQVVPRGLLGRIMVFIQFGVLTRSTLGRIYQRMAEIATDQSSAYVCHAPFGKPVQLTARQSKRLVQQTRSLGKQTGRVGLAERLADFLTTVADPAAARIRPIPFSKVLGCSTEDAIEFCLSAVSLGVLDMTWDVLCPVCRIASSNEPSLQSIAAHSHCEYCDQTFAVDFSRSVEVIFRAHPEIRQLDTKVYCIGGPFHSPHVIAQNRLKPGTQVEIGTRLKEGRYEIRSPQLDRSVAVQVSSQSEADVLERIGITLGPHDQTDARFQLTEGTVCLAVKNEHNAELLTRLETRSPRDDAVTAAWICQQPAFQKQFPEQIIHARQLYERKHVYLLLLKYMDADGLLKSIGDIRFRSAWSELQADLCNAADGQLQSLEDSPDHLLIAGATLSVLIRQLQLALNKLSDVSPLEAGLFACAINAGEVMVGHDKGRLQYFGETVRATSKLSNQIRAGHMIVPESLTTQDAWQLLDHGGLFQPVEAGRDVSDVEEFVEFRFKSH